MFTLKKGHQPGVYVPLSALFLVSFISPLQTLHVNCRGMAASMMDYT